MIFQKQCKANRNSLDIKTGFDLLDKKLGGSLETGLYVLGAISGIGKTTFALQMADQIAAQGVPVAFFSLEMGKDSLISKSLSRYMYTLDKKRALSARKIIKGEIENKNNFKQALNSYNQLNKNIIMIENALSITDIQTTISNIVNRRKQKPVIFIDYLQIIANQLYDDKRQSIDSTVTKLKRMSRDYQVPVIVISSFNRQNYTSLASFKSLKESGNIEFSADTVIALQFAQMRKQFNNGKRVTEEQIDKWKQGNKQGIRKMELSILKQRMGLASARAYYAYNPKFDHYKEVGDKIRELDI